MTLREKLHLLFTLREESPYSVFSGPYFPAFGLNTERYSVFSPNAGKKEPEKQQIRTFFTHESGVFVIFEHISYLVLVLLTLNI